MKKHMYSALAAWFILFASGASAEVIDLIQLQARHPALVHQWDFEGTTPRSRMRDKKGTLRLEVWNRDWTRRPTQGQPGRPQDPVQEFVPGLDASTTASRSYSDGSDNARAGSALRTQNPIVMPRQGTAEFLVYHSGELKWGSPFGGAAGFEADNRWVFSQGSRVMIGPNETTGILFPDMKPDRWYYGAVTWEIADLESERPNRPVTVNGWYADLGGDSPPVLEQSVADAVVWVEDPGVPVPFGIGAVGGSSSYLNGKTDAVALYNEILPVEVLQKHVSAIMESGASAHPGLRRSFFGG